MRSSAVSFSAQAIPGSRTRYCISMRLNRSFTATLRVPARFLGAMVWVLRAQGNTRAAIHLETLWNEPVASHAFSLFWAYCDLERLVSERRSSLFQVCHTYTPVHRPEQIHYFPLDSFPFPSNETHPARRQKHQSLACQGGPLAHQLLGEFRGDMLVREEYF